MTEIKLYRKGGLNELRDRAHETAKQHGWWEPQLVNAEPVDEDGVGLGHGVVVPVQRTFGDLMALVHSEASEALEDHRAGYAPDALTYTYKTNGKAEAGYDVRQYDGGLEVRIEGTWEPLTPKLAAELGYDAKPVGIPSEMADIIIRVLDICGFYGIDIEQAVRVKMAYNDTRPYRHGGKVL